LSSLRQRGKKGVELIALSKGEKKGGVGSQRNLNVPNKEKEEPLRLIESGRGDKELKGKREKGVKKDVGAR